MEQFLQKYKAVILAKVCDLTFQNCEGCEMDMGNQLAHTCVTLSPEERTRAYFNEAFESIDFMELLDDLKKAMKHDVLGELTCNEQENEQQEQAETEEDEEESQCEVSSSTQ